MANRFRDNYSGALIFRETPEEVSQKRIIADVQDLLEEVKEERRIVEKLRAGDYDGGDNEPDKTDTSK